MKGCDFVAQGATEAEVMKKEAEHVKIAHGMQHILPELAVKIRGAIHDEKTTA